MDIAPLHDWLVVKMLPFDQRSTIIELLGQSESVVRKGEVVSVGPGKRTPSGARVEMGVKPGDHVVFLRWHAEHRPGKANIKALEAKSAELNADLCMIRLNDILFTYDGNVTVDL